MLLSFNVYTERTCAILGPMTYGLWLWFQARNSMFCTYAKLSCCRCILPIYKCIYREL